MAGGQQRAGRGEGVAETTPPSTDEGAADTTTKPVDQDDASVDLTKCADCGSDKVVYVTEDPAAEQRGYCATHKPANVTDKMVQEQGGA